MTYLFLFTYLGNLWNCNISSVITRGPRPNWQYLDQFWREIWVSHLAAFTGPGPLISVLQCLHPSIPPSTLRPPCCHPWLCRGTPLMSHASISQAKSSRIFIVCQLLPVTDHFGSLATIFIMNIFILACYKYPEHFPQKTSIEDDSEIIARFSLYGDTIRIHDTIC